MLGKRPTGRLKPARHADDDGDRQQRQQRSAMAGEGCRKALIARAIRTAMPSCSW